MFEWRRSPAVLHQFRSVVLSAACPEHVRVLRRRRRERAQAVNARPTVQTHELLAQGECDGDEAIDSEDDQNPDGSVAAREKRELLQLARDRMQFFEDDEPGRLEPLGDDPGDERAQVAERHGAQVQRRRRAAHAPSPHHEEDEYIPDDARAEDERRRERPEHARYVRVVMHRGRRRNRRKTDGHVNYAIAG